MNYNVKKDGTVICYKDNTHVFQDIPSHKLQGALSIIDRVTPYFYLNHYSVQDGLSFLSLVDLVDRWAYFEFSVWKAEYLIFSEHSGICTVSTNAQMGCPSRDVVIGVSVEKFVKSKRP